jgi:phosphomannomutase
VPIATLQRFRQTINNRMVTIDVRKVALDRWRAELVRPTGTTALMPFYGSTPDEAAQHLCSWLTRVGRQAG